MNFSDKKFVLLVSIIFIVISLTYAKKSQDEQGDTCDKDDKICQKALNGMLLDGTRLIF